MKTIVMLTAMGLSSMAVMAQESPKAVEEAPKAAAAVPEVALITTEKDWCTFTSPESANVGDTLVVKVTLKNVALPTKLTLGLHYVKDSGEYGGFWALGSTQTVTDGNGTHTFTMKVPQKREGLGQGMVLLYLSPDGSFEKQTQHYNGAAFDVE